MITAHLKGCLYTCPCCRLSGFTRVGLGSHWCEAAPRLGGQKTKGRPLTADEFQAAIAAAQPPPSVTRMSQPDQTGRANS
jgi:hypothetical protein